MLPRAYTAEVLISTEYLVGQCLRWHHEPLETCELAVLAITATKAIAAHRGNLALDSVLPHNTIGAAAVLLATAHRVDTRSGRW